jgi:hypothetical protein
MVQERFRQARTLKEGREARGVARRNQNPSARVPLPLRKESGQAMLEELALVRLRVEDLVWAARTCRFESRPDLRNETALARLRGNRCDLGERPQPLEERIL